MKTNIVLGSEIKQTILEISQFTDAPFYLYDRFSIRRNCRKFKQISYEPKSICFAVMANSNEEFLRIVREEKLGAFVNSPDHLELVLKAGFADRELVYASAAMDKGSMRKARSSGATLILDSPGQLAQWLGMYPGSKVGIRCNIGELVTPRKSRAGYFIGKESRLGFSIDEIDGLKENPLISGLHIYVGTDILDIGYFLECYKHVLELSSFFPSLEYLDFGGGFGIGRGTAEDFDFATYDRGLTEVMNMVSGKMKRPIKLILEPGRIIGADAGYFVCRAVDIKKRNGTQLVGVNASCVQFPRPLFYPDDSYHPVRLIQENGSKNNDRLRSSIVGCSTYSRDYLAREIDMAPVAAGDIMVFCNAGSYCASLYTHFLGISKAREYFV